MPTAAPASSASATSPPDERDDVALVRASRAGDRAALDTLLRRHSARLGALCTRMLGNPHDGADALQEALVSIVRKLDRFEERSAFGTWAYRLTANVCLDELRRRKRRPDPADDLPLPEVAAAADAVVDREVVEAGLAQLPDAFRVAVVLRDLGGYDYAEIAELTEVPVGTVRSRIARGRAMLVTAIGNPADLDERPRT